MLRVISEDVPFSCRIPDEMPLKYIFLLKYFHSIVLSCFFEFHKVDFSKRSFAYQSDRDKVTRTNSPGFFFLLLVFDQFNRRVESVSDRLIAHSQIRLIIKPILLNSMCLLLSFIFGRI